MAEYEKGLIRTDRGLFIDKGNQVYDVRHPDFAGGAKGDGVTDDTAAIQAALDTRSKHILFPTGKYLVNSSISLYDHQKLVGTGVGPFGTGQPGAHLVAGPSLGTDPMLTTSASQLTRGGLYNLRLEGTGDASGGHALVINNEKGISDFWGIDEVEFVDFTGNAIRIIPTVGVAGNPLYFGHVKLLRCGQDGTSYGVYIERPNRAVVRIDFLAGDNNGAGLLYLKTLNTQAHVHIGSIQAERTIDGFQDNIIVVDAANGGFLNVDQFWIHDNITGGTDGNAFIKELNGKTLRFKIGQSFYQNDGSNRYLYGFDDGAVTVSVDEFERSTMTRFHQIGDISRTLTNDATPSVLEGNTFLTGGTTTITDFDDGVIGQEITILAKHSVTITHDGASIYLNGASNFNMNNGDTLTLKMIQSGIWYEISRSDNT